MLKRKSSKRKSSTPKKKVYLVIKNDKVVKYVKNKKDGMEYIKLKGGRLAYYLN